MKQKNKSNKQNTKRRNHMTVHVNNMVKLRDFYLKLQTIKEISFYRMRKGVKTCTN